MSKPELVRKRKPAARRSDIVLALIEERVDMIRPPASDDPVTRMLEINVKRLDELLDELKRSLGRKDESGEAE